MTRRFTHHHLARTGWPSLGRVRRAAVAAGAALLASLALVTPASALPLCTVQHYGPFASFTFAPSAAPTGSATTFDGGYSSGYETMVSGIDPDRCPDTDVVEPISSYIWSFGDGTGAASTGPTIAHTYAHAGHFTVSLTVVSAAHTSAPVNKTVPISDRPPTASMTAPGNALRGQSITFTGSGADPDGTVLKYQWSFGDGSALVSSTGSVSHTYTTLGTMHVVLVVVDDSGGTSIPVASDVIVANASPTAAFSTPASVTTTAQATFDASASADPDGAVTSYRWDFGDGTTNVASTASASHSYPTAGRYTVSLVVVDNDGTRSTPISHVLTVTAAGSGAGAGGSTGPTGSTGPSGTTGPSGAAGSTPPRPLQAALSVRGRPRPLANGVAITLSCARSSCRGSVTLTTIESLRGARIVGVTSAIGRERVRHQAVIVGRVTFALAAGKTRTTTVTLNRAGRMLLARFGRLPMAVTVQLVGTGGKHVPVTVAALTIRRAARR
jgi:PKD repeat protein